MNHIVRVGDTLTSIAARHQTTVAALVELNGIHNPDLIYVGMQLSIPADGPDTRGRNGRPVFSTAKRNLIALRAPKRPETLKEVPITLFTWLGWGFLKRQPDGRYHSGQDYGAKYGKVVAAAAAGKVIFSGRLPGGFGITIIVELPDRSCHRYAHLGQRYARRGDMVKKHEIIGNVGAYISPKGKRIDHLHFDRGKAGVLQANPNEWSAFATPEKTRARFLRV
ncbi:MAG: peptidoglycan DD-metalloendopeptidase family protein [Chloroflexi bacterium]|nr:peptidoglycan DD-metalloendopeptidase family protein [Chloroflexota bacterium]